jgi:hypothetical protein
MWAASSRVVLGNRQREGYYFLVVPNLSIWDSKNKDGKVEVREWATDIGFGYNWVRTKAASGRDNFGELDIYILHIGARPICSPNETCTKTSLFYNSKYPSTVTLYPGVSFTFRKGLRYLYKN